MAIAGLGLCVFVLAHVSGNFLIFLGPKAYNMYGYYLTSSPLLYVAEAGLIAIFLAHIVSGIYLTIRNRGARKQSYAVNAQGEKKTSLTTKTMWWQGVVIFVFVIFHLITFKFGTVYNVEYEGLVVRDLFRLVYEVFQSPAYVVWYIVALVILGYHLTHGFYSSLQTLGANHPKYTPVFKKLSLAYGLFISIGFISQPLYMFFIYKG